ncbi:hypothetical protein IRJ41_004838 [Triplophysa rosa]|uniref:Uncharacterized protein n=1 Tax=Triplophysa rosa TaxID=992332 RepID=A0A9W8CBQ9_TRIRA|nr:hypothetical protein IRJ41_004838 [Triplophysa rosa]
MNNPGDMRMDNGGSSDEESACGPSESPQENDTSTENNAEYEASSHGTSSKTSPSPPPPAEPKPQVHRRRKGRKTQIMEAIDKGLDRLLQNENNHDYDREQFEWEKEMERNRMELERKLLNFEIKKIEADEKRAEENRALMLQMFQCFRPQYHHSRFSAPHYYPYTPPPQHSSAEDLSTAPGPPASAAY